MPISPRSLFFSHRESSTTPVPVANAVVAAASTNSPCEPSSSSSKYPAILRNLSPTPAASIMSSLSPITNVGPSSSMSHTTAPPSDSRAVRVLLIPHKDLTRASPSSPFDPVDRELSDGMVMKLGRFVRSPANNTVPVPVPPVSNNPQTTPSSQAQPPAQVEPTPQQQLPTSTANPTQSELISKGGKIIDNIWFKSKVVSRTHAEMWVKEGQLYIKDGGSSSGTFLNRMRLSSSGKESRPYPLKDGDIIQLGVDYGGKQEEIYKCIIMKVSINSHSLFIQQRKKENPARFRSALRQLLTATNPYSTSKEASTKSPATVDCCICLCTIGPFSALFLAPCSHCFHYKCIRSLLVDCIMFQCPLCRQVANLEASVSMESLCDIAVNDKTSAVDGNESAKEVEFDQESHNKDDSDIAIEKLINVIKSASPSSDDERKFLGDLEVQLAQLKLRIGDGTFHSDHMHPPDTNNSSLDNATSSSLSSPPESADSPKVDEHDENPSIPSMVENTRFNEIADSNAGDALYGGMHNDL